MKAKTLVLGKNGQLAAEIRDLQAGDSDTIFVGKNEIRLEDPGFVSELLAKVKPQVVINCTAYVKFDKAETDVAMCRLLNVDFVRRLAASCSKQRAHLVHFSSDYVFDGGKATPYSEADPCRPLSVYGRSKYDGEIAVQEEAKSASIVRTSWLYSKSGDNFLKTMLKLADASSPLSVVEDQRGTPTWAHELARATMEYFAVPTGSVELFHFAGGGTASWYEFALSIMKIWGKSKAIVPIPTSAFASAGARPPYSALSTEKFKRLSGLEIPPWEESLRRCHQSWRTN